MNQNEDGIVMNWVLYEEDVLFPNHQAQKFMFLKTLFHHQYFWYILVSLI